MPSKEHSSIIPSEFTWGPLCISEEAFRMILVSHRVFVPFTDILQGYGRRIQENFYNWDGCRGKMSGNSASEGHRIYGELYKSSRHSEF